MYGKLFAQMYDGTLATKGPWQALATFQQLIILADKHGVVDMTAEAIARRTTFPLEVIQLGIAELEKRDPDSRTPDEEGRRILRLSESRPWGWRIVNYAHYRRIRSEEERQEYHREYWREKRSPKLKTQPDSTATQQTQQTQPIAVSSKQYAVSSTTGSEGNIDLVLTHYEKLHPKRKIVGKKLRSIVERALKDFSAGELIEALNGNAFDPWHKDRRKHELAYVFRDVDTINGFRERASRPPAPASGNGTEARARAERLYTAFTQHGFCQTLPLEAHARRIDELAAAKKILDPEHFKAELRAVKPWTWLGSQRETDKEKSITRIARAIATLQQPGAP